MKTSKNITIHQVKNANELDQFIPVEGQWFIDDHTDGFSEADIEQSVRNYMDAGYPIKVQVFNIDGHQITCDLPAHGTFLATRT